MSSKHKNNIYIKAIKYFENGEIDRAIKKCEEGISKDLKNVQLLNLKGLLLYLKGDLKSAIITWKINEDYNKDEIAKSYLRDCESDKEKIELFKRAEELVKKIKIDQAIDILKKCSESDFNSIRVNILIASCYIKKANYSLASIHLKKALELDCNNREAKALEKQLMEYGQIKIEVNRTKSKVKIFMASSIAICLFIGIIFGFCNLNNKNDLGQNLEINSNDKDVELNENNKKEEDSKEEENKIEELNEEKEIGENNTENVLVNIQDYIEVKDYASIDRILGTVDKNKCTEKEKAQILKAEELLKSNEAIDYYYNTGINEYRNTRYDEAINNFNMIYKYGINNYLYEHGLYFLAITNQKIKNNLEAIKYHEDYYNKFNTGTYIEEVIYSLTILYKEEDLTKSKTYAYILKNNYPESIYNNEEITNLLEQI